MNITDLLYGNGGGGYAPIMAMLANGSSASPFAGPASMPGSTMPGSASPMGGGGGMGGAGGMDWATLMQMMSRMGGGGMSPLGRGMSGMGGALGNVGAVMGGANMGGAQSPILQAMQAALAGMRGGGAQQPMSPINTLMRYR